MTVASVEHEFSIIAVDKFIQATRDSGYKGTASAIAELVDNAIQADAQRIQIVIENAWPDDTYPLRVIVQDNGSGMDPFTLRHALRFGGSTRFNDRKGLGRYGMGLPNSSLSQARRVTVYTRQDSGEIYSSNLDVDEIAQGKIIEVPAPSCADYPIESDIGKSGTTVVWSHCDRLDNRRISTLSRKLTDELGRRFRHFLWSGVSIAINGDAVEPIDPLFLHPKAKRTGAERFCDPIEYEVAADPTSDSNAAGIVRVTFSELPVHLWHDLSNQEKRQIGISKGAGVSIVRGQREVDYGWFFLSEKRRENYDDWWRCEIQFDPVLDEAFGITHTKQQIRPKAHLLEALSEDIGSAARALNARARKSHLAVKAAGRYSRSEEVASEKEMNLEPLPVPSKARGGQVLKELKKRHPELKNSGKSEKIGGGLKYKIVESSVRDTGFFTYVHEEDRLVLVLNPGHPFYKQVYKPLLESEATRDRELRTYLELLLLSAARSLAAEEDPTQAAHLDEYRIGWSDTLATFLSK